MFFLCLYLTKVTDHVRPDRLMAFKGYVEVHAEMCPNVGVWWAGTKKGSWLHRMQRWRLFYPMSIAHMPKKVSAVLVNFLVMQPMEYVQSCFSCRPRPQAPAQPIDVTLWWDQRFLNCFSGLQKSFINETSMDQIFIIERVIIELVCSSVCCQ